MTDQPSIQVCPCISSIYGAMIPHRFEHLKLCSEDSWRYWPHGQRQFSIFLYLVSPVFWTYQNRLENTESKKGMNGWMSLVGRIWGKLVVLGMKLSLHKCSKFITSLKLSLPLTLHHCRQLQCASQTTKYYYQADRSLLRLCTRLGLHQLNLFGYNNLIGSSLR